ncbi:MAG: 4-hydroxythreonine-4-phosphate dehydrogenase PdxA [Phycisphaerales bacterium]|nr:4-hydroxythreonine-4-phosphate dehydrogenase PdxA [Phycisphaerales bacterium]
MNAALRHCVIGLSMGDPCGIGAEIIVKSLADPRLRHAAAYRVFGESKCLARAAEAAGLDADWWIESPRQSADLRPVRGQVVITDHPQFTDAIAAEQNRPEVGPSRIGGESSLAFLSAAVDAALCDPADPHHVDAIVTAPIAKSSWRLAGLRRFPGHTEFLADRTKSRHFAMMFVAPQLRVVLATIHVPLGQVAETLTIGRVFEPILLGRDACRDLFGIERPRIAVCGLNPHASESGLFGDEERRLIEPAIRQAVERGIDASGPFPADTIFNAALAGRYDLVVAMYHDQGLIPVKLLARDQAVNVTIGLPIIRTSPDHGTAFDIAGRNAAHPGSMIAAIQLAIEMARRRMV